MGYIFVPRPKVVAMYNAYGRESCISYAIGLHPSNSHRSYFYQRNWIHHTPPCCALYRVTLWMLEMKASKIEREAYRVKFEIFKYKIVVAKFNKLYVRIEDYLRLKHPVKHRDSWYCLICVSENISSNYQQLNQTQLVFGSEYWCTCGVIKWFNISWRRCSKERCFSIFKVTTYKDHSFPHEALNKLFKFRKRNGFP